MKEIAAAIAPALFAVAVIMLAVHLDPGHRCGPFGLAPAAECR